MNKHMDIRSAGKTVLSLLVRLFSVLRSSLQEAFDLLDPPGVKDALRAASELAKYGVYTVDLAVASSWTNAQIAEFKGHILAAAKDSRVSIVNIRCFTTDCSKPIILALPSASLPVQSHSDDDADALDLLAQTPDTSTRPALDILLYERRMQR